MNFFKNVFGNPKRLVGVHKHNKYFECAEAKVREVETATRNPLDAVNSHPLWESWLRHTRKTPPTQAELDEFDARRVVMQQNVAEIERKERKLILQERAEKERDRDDDDAAIVPFKFGK